jgi:hypothetical protein
VVTRHLQRIRQRTTGTDPVIAARMRRWALISLILFLTACLIGGLLMTFGIGVPAWGWGRI